MIAQNMHLAEAIVSMTDFVDLLHYRFYGGKCDFILAREECDKENDANHYPDNINV